MKPNLASAENRVVRSITLVIVICLASGACDLPFDRELATQEFLIRQGEHYATPRLTETIDAPRLKFRATFDESAMYLLDDPSMQSNKNKLMGFSDCGTLHHENSARFAWQWFNDRLEIFAYCYVDSTRIEQFVGTVNINEENVYELTSTANEYGFWLNGERKVSIARKAQCEEGVKYKLYPYFGGSVPAPHDVRIKIEILK